MSLIKTRIFTVWQYIAVLASMLLLASNAAQAKEWKEVRLASEGGYPPFSFTALDGSVSGLDVDIGNAICAEMKLKCVWVKIAWEELIPMLNANKFDAIVASMAINEERRMKVEFTNKYYSTPLALLAKKDTKLKPEASSVKGKKIGLCRGTIADDFATRFWNEAGAEIFRYRLQDEAELDLAAGRLDAVLTDYWQAYGSFLKTPAGKNFVVAGGKIYGNTPDERKVIGEGVAIAVRKKDQDLKKIFDQGISAIRANGVYNKIVSKYFSEDIYGQ